MPYNSEQSDFDVLAGLLDSHREAAMLALLDMPPVSTAIVAGAYKGDTVAFLRQMYGVCRVFAFEPQEWAAALLSERFQNDPWVYVRGYGLGIVNADDLPMGEFGTDACSFIFDPLNVRTVGHGMLSDVAEVWENEGITGVDLLLLNMEGYEYRLLPYMASVGLLARVGNVVLQTHEQAAVAGVNLTDALTPTHELVVDLGPAWQWWRRRGMAASERVAA